MLRRQRKIEEKVLHYNYTNKLRSKSKRSGRPIEPLEKSPISGRQLYAKYETSLARKNAEDLGKSPPAPLRPKTSRAFYDDNRTWVDGRDDRLHDLRVNLMREENKECQYNPKTNRKFNGQIVTGSFMERQQNFEIRKVNHNKETISRQENYSFKPKLCIMGKNITRSTGKSRGLVAKGLYMHTEPSYQMDYFSRTIDELKGSLIKESEFDMLAAVNISNFDTGVHYGNDWEEGDRDRRLQA